MKYRFTSSDSDLSEIIKKCQNVMTRIVDAFYSLKNNKSPGFEELHVNEIKRNVYKCILNILNVRNKSSLNACVLE